MRLIDADAAIEQVERREKLMAGDKRVGVEHIKVFLQNRPTIDAEPVRHGRWKSASAWEGIPTWMCSECDTGYGRMWKYCPNCGAKMDLEVEHD